MPNKFYISTAISYPNGRPHIGHAYELICADAIARFNRITGKDVLFSTGTDEHGLKMLQTAEKENISVELLAKRNSDLFLELSEKINASNNYFIRTTDKSHYKSAQALWNKLFDNGDIYLDKHRGWYSIRDESYIDISEIIELDDGTKTTQEGSPVEWQEVDSYFFKLSKYQNQLLELYEDNGNFIRPEYRKKEIINFIKNGLHDVSISRNTFSWGIPVPNDSSHVMYVWIDALANYLTCCGYPDTDNEKWGYWPASVHIIGKDIMRFHTIIWPALLISAGLSVPKQIFGHGFITNNGQKISKSLNNVIDPFVLINKYGRDQLRYFLLREIPFGQDGSYSDTLLLNRCNSDLSNNLGNLVQRTFAVTHKICGTAIPYKNNLNENDWLLLNKVYERIDIIEKEMNEFQIHIAIASIWEIISELNRYITNNSPWSLAKTDIQRAHTVLWVVLESLRVVGILIQPFIPDAANKLLDLLGIPEYERNCHFIHKEINEHNILSQLTISLFPKLI
jgi:methionyl-tRNA synthetase